MEERANGLGPKGPATMRRHLLSAAATGIRSHPDSFLQASDIPIACRICWGEEDGREEGAFLTPCNCTGTSRYVHALCLQRWMASVAANRGISYACRCDICRSPYKHLPPHMTIRERPYHRFKRSFDESLDRAFRSRAGNVFKYSLTVAYVYCTGSAVWGAGVQAAAIPSLLVRARHDPITTLRPLAPRFASAMILEPILSSRDFWFHIETAIFYAFGWVLDASARMLESLAHPVVVTLPVPLRFAFAAALSVPKGIGLAFQALDLSLMAVYGGAISGFLEGVCKSVAAPFKGMALAIQGVKWVLGWLARGAGRGGAPGSGITALAAAGFFSSATR